MYRVIIFLLFPVLLSAQNQNLDAKNGYGNFKFGTSPNEYKDLSLEIDEGNTKLYSLNESPIKMEGIDLEYVRLTFLKNKLSTISLQTKNQSGKKLLQSLQNNYGEPKKNAKNKSYEWDGVKIQLVFTALSNNDAVIDLYQKSLK